MRILLPILVIGHLAALAQSADPADQLPPPPEGESWKLVWHDEFDGDRLDESKWTYRPDGKPKGGWCSRKAVSLDGDGHLIISTFMDGDKPTDGYDRAHHKFDGHRATVPGVMEGWHTLGLLWLPDEYVIYVDGKETWRSKAGGVCQVPQYMLLSDEIGTWAGDISKANLPDQFMVDYVRVYDLVDEK